MAQVRWSARALDNLEDIQQFIEREGRPLTAERLVARIRSAALNLADTPFTGRSISGDRRELTTVYPYLIRYRVARDQVLITEVRHGARRRAQP